MRERRDLSSELEHLVALERVHRGNAHEIGPALGDDAGERPAEAEVGKRDAMPRGLERGGDVLHAERLDAEERAEAEAFVGRDGPEQEDVHRESACR
jgi:hypothetical protein